MDEMKLSESLKVTSSGFIEGFVDLTNYNPLDQSTQAWDLGLVVLYQPFSDHFSHILGVFGFHGNVKADKLAKIAIDARLAVEKSGLFVDFASMDGASWTRNMWRQFGIKETSVTCLQSKAFCRSQQKSGLLIRLVRSQQRCVNGSPSA